MTCLCGIVNRGPHCILAYTIFSFHLIAGNYLPCNISPQWPDIKPGTSWLYVSDWLSTSPTNGINIFHLLMLLLITYALFLYALISYEDKDPFDETPTVLSFTFHWIQEISQWNRNVWHNETVTVDFTFFQKRRKKGFGNLNCWLIN